jgi:hypothetical protein
MMSIEEKGQTSVGAHHQNGKAEKRIGDLKKGELQPYCCMHKEDGQMQ